MITIEFRQHKKDRLNGDFEIFFFTVRNSGGAKQCRFQCGNLYGKQLNI